MGCPWPTQNTQRVSLPWPQPRSQPPEREVQQGQKEETQNALIKQRDTAKETVNDKYNKDWEDHWNHTKYLYKNKNAIVFDKGHAHKLVSPFDIDRERRIGKQLSFKNTIDNDLIDLDYVNKKKS